MFVSRLRWAVLKHIGPFVQTQQKRNIQVTIVGAANSVGSNVALLLKKNPKVTRLNLHDFDTKIEGIAKELSVFDGESTLCGFVGEQELKTAVHGSKLILMVCNPYNLGDCSPYEQALLSAPLVEALCTAVANRSKEAIIGICTYPINIMVPYAFSVLKKFNSLNPYRVFGITGNVEARARSLAANVMRVNPRHLTVPVIGGHSESTIVPLYSNLKPCFYTLDNREISALTQLVRSGIPEVEKNKEFAEYTTICTSWAVHDFAQKFIDAFLGSHKELHCFTANPHFGTEFFSGPVTIGAYGLVRSPSSFEMSLEECELLSEAIENINKDIDYADEIANKNSL